MEQLGEIISMIGGGVSSIALPLLTVLLFYDSRKRNEAAKAKQAEAEARAAEEANITSYAEEWKTLYEQRDKRVDELNAKIDSLYVLIEDDRKRIRELQEKNTELTLENQSLHFRKCEVRGCKDRQPPSDY